MKLKKILALVLALMLTMSAFAFAETAEDPAAEETAAAAEADDTADAAAEEEVPEHDYEVITDPVVATVGDVEIHVSDCMPRFMNYYQTLAQYANYGIDVSNYITSIKQTVLSEMVQMEIEKVKVKELGYDQFTEEELSEIEADAAATEAIFARRGECAAELRRRGFSYISLDLEGYRTGSLNEVL